MDIIEQLRALERRRKKSSSQSSLATLVTGRELPQLRQKNKESLIRILPGEVRTGEAGSFLYLSEMFSREHRQGFQALPEQFEPALLNRLAAGEEEIAGSCPHLVYLDTETTGLAGGAGTFAFLVGLGFWQEQEGTERQFVVEQYFMRDYDEEPAMLAALDERFKAEGFDAVVTYNGRRFDVPLLTARYISNRKRDRISQLPQLDLLYPVRQLWKLKYGDCSLANIERQVLGVRRGLDIPGADIPTTYFQFVRGGDPRRLLPIFQHNVDDILSLAALTGRVVEQMAIADPERLDPVEVYSLGKMHLQRGALEEASAFLEKSDWEMLPFQIYLRSQKELSLAYKRKGQWERAVEFWLETVESFQCAPSVPRDEGGLDLFAFEELAKYFEHCEKQFDRAREVVLKALELLAAQSWPEMEAKLNHRLARLERKIGSAPVSSSPCEEDK